jgi:exonuclease VII small subunit
VELTRRCQTGLKDAEQRVETLLQPNGTITIEPLAEKEPR